MSISIGNTSIPISGLDFYLDASSDKNYLLDEVEVLVVAGGGGGGANHAGGGGAGGLVYNTSYKVTAGVAITVTVGNGGSKSTNFTAGPIGGTGQNSVFGSITAYGGGGGGNRRDAGTVGLENGGSGGSGGGGGGQGSDNNPTSPGGSGTYGQGHPGGTASYHAGGGGGGAGGPGATTYGSLGGSTGTCYPGDGGPGLCINISGYPKYYAGGGGGGGFIGGLYAGSGGLGGGGHGQIDGVERVDGMPNTGGGGGGANGGGNSNGGNGGSGVVIVRYPGPQKALGGNTITFVSGYTIHTFTGSGTFTPFTTASTNLYGLADITGNQYTHYTRSGNNTYSTQDGIRCVNVAGGQLNLTHGQIDSWAINTTNQSYIRLGDSHSYVIWGRILSDGEASNWRTLIRTYPEDHPIIVQDSTDLIGFYDNGGIGFNSFGVTVGGLGIANTWAMWSVVSEGGQTRLNINGTFVGNTVFTSASGNLHRELGNHYSSGSQPFGYISEAMLFNNKALTSSELQLIYNATSGRY